jgi:RNA polymerase sigma factor (sigma-70 family)
METEQEYQHPNQNEGFGIRLETRVKNAALVNAREQLGLSVKAAAEQMKVPYSTLIYCEGLKLYPSEKRKKRICSFYRRKGIFLVEEDVFPDELRTVKAQKKYIAERTIPKENLLPIHTISERLLPAVSSETEEELDSESLREAMNTCVSQLTEREQKILKMYYEDGMSHEDIAKEMGLCAGRIGQIHAKALRKLRHPCRADKLAEFLYAR